MFKATHSFAIAVGFLAVVLSSCGPVQEEASPRVVTTEWVAGRLGNEELVLIHVGDREEYDEAHIPGARFMSLQMISTPHGEGLMLEMPPIEQLDSVFESIGVSDNSRIVIYWGKDWVTPAARVALTLDYLGMASRTSILDGGMPAWQAEGRPTTAESPPPRTGSFTAQVREDVIAQIDWLSASLNDPNVCIIDARTPEFYSGERSGRMPRPGRIPSAKNIPFPTVLDEETLKFKDPEELRRLLAAAGAEPGDTVVTYCHIGQQASLVYYMARNLGYTARMYDGSFEEWSQREDLPVESDVSQGN